jgi:hypothetical protein
MTKRKKRKGSEINKNKMPRQMRNKTAGKSKAK